MTGIDDYTDVSSPDGEPIAVWERVSTDMTRQDIASQTRDLRKFIADGSYRVERVFRFEASAFHGDHAPEQAEMLADVAAGRYKTVVAAMSSRYDRQPPKYALYFATKLNIEYDARVVAIDDPNYGDMDSEMGIIGTVFKAKSNYDYSKAISDNVNRKFRTMDAEGFHRGGFPAGYVAVGPKGCKNLELHPVASELVMQAFLHGSSTPVIARTFKAANARYGLRLPASPEGVALMLRAPEYSTGRHKQDSACQCTFPPLVSPAQQEAAVAALENRRTGDNVSSRAIAKDDFSGAVWCPCGASLPMYRYFSGGRKHTDGTPGPRTRRYVCKTSAGGCGKSVAADETDREIDRIMGTDITPWWVPFTTDPNAERDRSLVAITQALKDLPNLGLDEDAEDAKRAELRAERKRLQAIPDQPAVTFAKVKTDEHGKSLSQGDHWQMMTGAEKRDSLTAAGSDFPFAYRDGGRVVVEFRPSDAERAVKGA
jgi:DNA invertase Pin-like site-specific DNA recombinase